MLLLAFLAYAIPNLDEINNPWTGESDYFVDVTDLGSNLNMSGYNLTVDNIDVISIDEEHRELLGDKIKYVGEEK